MRFRGGLVFKAHRLLHHSTLGSRAIKRKKRGRRDGWYGDLEADLRVWEEGAEADVRVDIRG